MPSGPRFGAAAAVHRWTRMRAFLKRVLPESVRGVLINAYCGLMRLMKPLLPQNLLLAFKVALSHEYVIAYWWIGQGGRNFGDALNPVIIEALSGKRVVHSSRILNLARKPVYYAIGSILRGVRSSNAVMWGSGFIDSRDTLKRRPKEVRAVRGPLTRRKLLELGVECPSVYGDPALLCPLFIKPGASKRYSLGIVPHFTDWHSPLLERFRVMPNVAVIDITSGVPNVIDRVNECEAIASSALHGLILADAYGIPSVWVKISGKIGGDDFKFSDYFQSVGREDAAPIQLTDDTTPSDLLSARTEYHVKVDLEKLVEACPFAGGQAFRRHRA